MYTRHPGWTQDISGVRRFADLPAAAQRYVAAMMRSLLDVAYEGRPRPTDADLPNLRYLGVGPLPSQIIKDVNSSSGRISLSVEKQTRAATMISQNVSQAHQGVGEIARSIAEVAKAAGDMSRNVAEAARGATDVSRNVGEAAKAANGISSDIHQVSSASKSTNQVASKVSDSAEQLDQIGRELKKLVGRFKIQTEDEAAE